MASRDLVIVTGSDSSHFKSMLQLLGSIRAHEKRAKVVAYDLGLSEEEREELRRRFKKYELVRFDFDKYPEHFDIKVKVGEWAWKPAIVWETLSNRGGIVCWMDAGNALVSNLDELRDAASIKGFYSPYSPGTVGEWTHPGTLKRLGLSQDFAETEVNINGACVAFDSSNEKAMALAKEWFDRACDRDCIAPAGSDRSNHRQDQALLTVLAYRAGMIDGVPHEKLGFRIHQDVEDAPFEAMTRRLKRSLVSVAHKYNRISRTLRGA